MHKNIELLKELSCKELSYKSMPSAKLGLFIVYIQKKYYLVV